MLGLFILACGLAFAAVFVLVGKKDAEGLKLTFGLLAVGGALMVLPMASIYGDTREIIGFLLFFFSYLFLIPAIGAYQKYRSFVSDAFLSQEERTEKEHAWNRTCIFICCFIFGLLAGLLIFLSALAV